VVVQPGAEQGQQAYCPVSGVVFQVKDSSPHREVDGRPVYFCCESCANYFTANRERVIAARGLSAR
jgi:YHS domain-containing protein